MIKTIQWWKALLVSMLLVSAFASAVPQTLAETTTVIYTNPIDFEEATLALGTPIAINFNEIDASPVNNTFEGRDTFDGSTYASQGITFSSPNDHPLYISPGGLFWNPSNSLSVGRFPFDPYFPYIFNNDDDLFVTLDPPCMAVGFILVDNGPRQSYEFAEFFDLGGNLIEHVILPYNFMLRRAFIGIVSLDHPIAAINIVEAPNDSDDVNFDDFTFFPAELPIEAMVDIYPHTINLQSKGKWIYAYIELPEGYDVTGLDVGTIKLENTIVTQSQPTATGDYGGDGIPNLQVRFDRQALFEYLDGTTGEIILTLSGKLSDGTSFEGSDSLTVIDPDVK